MILVYITKKCEEEAKKNGCPRERLEKLKLQIEKEQRITPLLEPLSQEYFCKKKFKGFRGRLIAQEKIFDDDTREQKHKIIVFLSYLIRGDNKYYDFQQNPEEKGEVFFADRYSQDELKKYIEGRLKDNPPKPKPELSGGEYNFLFDNSENYSFDEKNLIHESDKWTKKIKSDEFSAYKKEIYDKILDIVTDKNGNDSVSEQKTENEHSLIFKNSDGFVFLADIFHRDTKQEEIYESVELWKKKFDENEKIKLSKRSYPQNMLSDYNIWLEIESNERVNLTLSNEEEEVLKSMNKTDTYPLFINGRAGSGKSTILQYIFPVCFHKAKKSEIASPAYFTYNYKLLKVAKENIETIVKTDDKYKDIESDSLQKYFFVLKKYLLELVNDTNMFNQNNYVDLRRFNSFWNEWYKNSGKKEKKDYSATVSWHIIRTYIKGWNMDDGEDGETDKDDYAEMDIDDYGDLSDKQKTVSNGTFEKVYKNTWEKYKKKKKEENLWDDQDLVQYIIKNDLAKPVFSGIFCDEAQDFTRAELEVLFRLSIFSDRDSKHDITGKIPFAFAGDELQTLNPTGFRWDILKSTFTYKFIWSINSNAKTEINFNVLKNNYRSTPSIVRFSNLLQLFRSYQLDIKGLIPQKHWQSKEKELSVVHFLPKDANFWKNISNLNDAVFILPCDDENEIPEFVKKDEFLKENIEFDENRNPKNYTVMTANSSKGLEFERVVVYGFGKDEVIKDKILLNDEKISANSDSTKLPIGYHINKTYVAITRAKKELFIIDDDLGVDNLWGVIQKKELINKCLESNKNWREEDLSLYSEGNEEFFVNKRTNDEDVAVNAAQFKELGLSEKNPYRLRQASRLFSNQDSGYCSAFAFFFEENYEKAGNEFENAGYFREAIYSYWLAKNYKKIEDIINQKSDMKSEVVYIISNAINNPSKSEVLLRTIEILSSKDSFVVSSLGEYFTQDLCSPILWENINLIISKLKEDKPFLNKNQHIINYIKLIKNKGAKINSGIIFEMAIELKNYEIAKDCYNPEEHKKHSNQLAEMAYDKQDHEFAVFVWEKNPDRDEKKYNIAKSIIAKYPENIEYLFKLEEYENIIGEFHKHEQEKLSDKYISFIVQSLFVKKRNEEAINLFEKIEEPKNFVSLFESASGLTKKEYITLIPEHLNICQKIAEILKDSDKYISNIVKERKNIESIYIALALSMFEKYSNNTEKQISEFLNNECVKNFEKIPHKELYLFDVGKAVEMGGKFTDTLDFYEKTENFFKDNEEYGKLAVSRWVWAKKEQIKDDEKKEQKLTNPREIDDFKRKIEKRKNEVEENKKRYKLVDDIPSYFSSLTWAKIFKFILEYEQEKHDIEFGHKKIDDPQKTYNEKTAVKPEETVLTVDKVSLKEETAVFSQIPSVLENEKIEDSIFDFYDYKFERIIKYSNLTITLPDKGKIIFKNNKIIHNDVDLLKSDIAGKENYLRLKDFPLLVLVSSDQNKIFIYFIEHGIELSFEI